MSFEFVRLSRADRIASFVLGGGLIVYPFLMGVDGTARVTLILLGVTLVLVGGLGGT